MKGFPVGFLSTPTTKGYPPKKTNQFEGGLKDKGSRGFGSLKGKLEKITRFGGFRDLKANPHQTTKEWRTSSLVVHVRMPLQVCFGERHCAEDTSRLW